jgi:hypothetical protein
MVGIGRRRSRHRRIPGAVSEAGVAQRRRLVSYEDPPIPNLEFPFLPACGESDDELGASAGRADARRRGAGVAATSPRSGNEVDARPPPRCGGLRLPAPQALARRPPGFLRFMQHRSRPVTPGGMQNRSKM